VAEQLEAVAAQLQEVGFFEVSGIAALETVDHST
jgi:hypothetical protein